MLQKIAHQSVNREKKQIIRRVFLLRGKTKSQEKELLLLLFPYEILWKETKK